MNIKVIKTDDTEKEVWTYLGLFSTKNAESRISVIHKNLSPKELKEKAFWINSCVNQAREYYTAAKEVSMLTKPLLLYYGMYSLAKALIFLNNPKVDLGTLNHHGLKKPKISDSPKKFLNAEVKIHKKGVFHHLSRCMHACMPEPISDINVRFVVMFLLGHIVRYKPPLWQDILKTAYKSIIDKFLFTSERKFPCLILNELLQQNILFAKS